MPSVPEVVTLIVRTCNLNRRGTCWFKRYKPLFCQVLFKQNSKKPSEKRNDAAVTIVLTFDVCLNILEVDLWLYTNSITPAILKWCLLIVLHRSLPLWGLLIYLILFAQKYFRENQTYKLNYYILVRGKHTVSHLTISKNKSRQR